MNLGQFDCVLQKLDSDKNKNKAVKRVKAVVWMVMYNKAKV